MTLLHRALVVLASVLAVLAAPVGAYAHALKHVGDHQLHVEKKAGGSERLCEICLANAGAGHAPISGASHEQHPAPHAALDGTRSRKAAAQHVHRYQQRAPPTSATA